MRHGTSIFIGKLKTKIKRINMLVKDIERNGAETGIGKPEPLKENLNGYWSRRIDEKNRLVYKIENDELQIISCRKHY